MVEYEIWEVLKALKKDNTLQFSNNLMTIGLNELKILEVKSSIFDEKTLDKHLSLAPTAVKWTLVKQPVSFEQALKSDKHCKLEHEYIKNKYIGANDSDLIDDLVSDLKNGRYLSMKDILIALGWITSESEFKKILEEGKFYLED